MSSSTIHKRANDCQEIEINISLIHFVGREIES